MANAQRGDDAIWMALIADQIGDTAKRDTALDLAKELAATNRSGKLNANGNGVLSVAFLVQQDLAAGGEGKIDAKQVEKFLEPLDGLNRFLFRCSLAIYLNQHGQTERALDYWRQCMGWTRIDARYRTLAGATLLEHGITPEDYADLLQPNPDAHEPPAQEEDAEE